MRYTAYYLPFTVFLALGCSTETPTAHSSAIIGVDKTRDIPFMTYATSVYFALEQPNGNECWYRNTVARYTNYSTNDPANSYKLESQELLTPLALGRSSLSQVSQTQLTNTIKEQLKIEDTKQLGLAVINITSSAATYVAGGILSLAARISRNTQWYEMGQALRGQASQFGGKFMQQMDLILPKLAKIKDASAVVFYTTRKEAGDTKKVVGLMEYGAEKFFKESLVAASHMFGQGDCPQAPDFTDPIPEPTAVKDGLDPQTTPEQQS